MDKIVGIDLGTTNSVIAVVENGVPRVVKDPVSGESILPSVVGIDPSGGLLVGRSALNQAALFPGSTIRSVKRHMGKDKQLTLGDRKFSPPEISAIILGRLRQWAEDDLGCVVTKAVITVPAYFDDSQREATRLAGELAGLEVLRIINEPTAAALVYDPENDDPQRILVYDLGGGTFDVSIVALESGVVEVLSTYGDTQLGGDDFDALLCDKLVESTESRKAAIRKDPAAMARLSIAAEAAKCRLSFETFTDVAEEFLLVGDPNSNLETTLERDDYDKMITPLMERTIACVDAALEDAGLHAGQLDRVILVGGSTRTPLVYNLLVDKLGHHPNSDIDPDLCVALGAAVQGALLSGEAVHRVLVDITPHTLGVRCADGNNPMLPANIFAPVIDRGTALPCKRSQTFYTTHDGQEQVLVEVYQGESRLADENHYVGRVELTDLGRYTPENSPISVTFTLNLSGMLEVRAVDRSTGKEAVATINRTGDDSSVDELTPENQAIASQQIADLLGRSAATAPSLSTVTADQISADQVTTDRNSPLWRRLQQLQSSCAPAKATAGEQDAEEIDSLLSTLENAALDGDEDAFETAAATLDDLMFYLNDSF